MAGKLIGSVKELLKEVKANVRKLETCEKHNFGKFDRSIHLDLHPREKMFCANCGGLEELRDVILYARGYRAAGGSVEDIIQGFFDD